MGVAAILSVAPQSIRGPDIPTPRRKRLPGSDDVNTYGVSQVGLVESVHGCLHKPYK